MKKCAPWGPLETRILDYSVRFQLFLIYFDLQGRQLRQKGGGTTSDPATMGRAKPAVFFLTHTAADWGVLKKDLRSWA